MTSSPRGSGAGARRAVNDPFGGLVLALDTASGEGSAAIGGRVGGGDHRLEVLARVGLEAREEHASLLIPRIRQLMEKIGAGLEEFTAIVVGAGPGSFTGVRVGAATAKGLARALNLPLYAFSSLAAAAAEDGSGRFREEGLALSSSPHRSDGILISDFDTLRPRCVLFDARGNRVYAGAYRLGDSGFETLLEPRATELAEVLSGLIPPAAFLMGDGALRHRAILESAGHLVLPPPFGRPTADGLIRLLSLAPDTRPLKDPGRWEPEYLRSSGAERMRKAGSKGKP